MVSESAWISGKTAIFEMCLVRLFQQRRADEHVKAGKSLAFSQNPDESGLIRGCSISCSFEILGPSKNAGYFLL